MLIIGSQHLKIILFTNNIYICYTLTITNLELQMKKLFFYFILILSFFITAYAEEVAFTADVSNNLYTYENNKAVFKPLSDEQYKALDKSEKKNYKTIKKAQKYLDKGRMQKLNNKNFEKFHLKAISYNPYLWPAYHNLSEYYYNAQNYGLCIKYSNSLLQNASFNFL